MHHVRLEVINDDFGGMGLVLAGMPRFDGLAADLGDGLTIAHDVLEHQNGVANMGPAWDELEAIGGIWYVRGQWGDLQTNSANNYSMHEILSNDVVSTFSTWYNEDDRSMGPDSASKGSRAHDEDESFNEIIKFAKRGIESEYQEDWEIEDSAIADYLDLALRSMRKGFRKAKKRFETKKNNHWKFDAYSLFSAIRGAVNDNKDNIYFEGQEFILSYGNGEATIKEIEVSY